MLSGKMEAIFDGGESVLGMYVTPVFAHIKKVMNSTVTEARAGDIFYDSPSLLRES